MSFYTEIVCSTPI